jgi:hypothetical protein
LALTSPTSGGRSVSTVPLQTKATEFYISLLQDTHFYLDMVLCSMSLFNIYSFKKICLFATFQTAIIFIIIIIIIMALQPSVGP